VKVRGFAKNSVLWHGRRPGGTVKIQDEGMVGSPALESGGVTAIRRSKAGGWGVKLWHFWRLVFGRA